MATRPQFSPHLNDLIRERWQIPDWDRLFPWWLRPAHCRILMYADSMVHLSGGGFQGLTQVKTLLESRAYSYVQFTVGFCHRDGTDPSATIRPNQPSKLTDLDILNQYDEIWLFGLNGGQSLDANEVALMDEFMAAPKYGGVLHTGDHADLGSGLAQQVKRVGAMRLYPAPPNVGPTWNTTLTGRPGEVSPYSFFDQSDDLPQTIRWKPYSAGLLSVRPHPVLCGPDGPIDVLPDHQHEGEALAPAVAGDPDWPTENGHQEAPEVIAWGMIKDPGATRHGTEIGVISAYNGHMSGVGRIVADSTWHHWFDINLLGDTTQLAPYIGYAGSAAGQAALKKIDAYHLNAGIWLAPPSVQAAMRAAAWWSVIWHNVIIELPFDAPLWQFGAAGISVLGGRAPRCAVFAWIWPLEPIYKPRIPWPEWVQIVREIDMVTLPVEQYVAGGIVRELSRAFGPHGERRSISDAPPSPDEVAAMIERGTDAGIAAIKAEAGRQAALLGRIVEQNFRFAPATRG